MEEGGTFSELSAQRAVVVPRAHREGSDASLPIEQLILPVVLEEKSGLIVIKGDEGAGKTTTLRHLRSVLPGDLGVRFFDEDHLSEAREAAALRVVILASPDFKRSRATLATFELSRWSLDDCAEYLVARHREQCKSVLTRLQNGSALKALRGSPQLLALVMEAMAIDPALMTWRDVLRRHIGQNSPPGPALDRMILGGLQQARLEKEPARWWRHKPYQHVCFANWIASQLCQGIIPTACFRIMDGSSPLIPEIAEAARNERAAIECLENSIKLPKSPTEAGMAASILIAMNPDWHPANGKGLNLNKAQLAGARWAGIDLTGASLVGTNLAGADLNGANLTQIIANDSNFRAANLRGAQMRNAHLVGADLSDADLTVAIATRADFLRAKMDRCKFVKGNFQNCRFIETDMNGVKAESADFSGAWLHLVGVADADFTSANFILADMDQVDLTQTQLIGACFAKGIFRCCNFEGLELPSADFDDANLKGSLMTGTRIPDGRFRNAKLAHTGLADIEWENADLQGADFEGASFHLGSTRSGLVESDIPSEGTRTGFYTDEFNDRLYKAPEEIRKACLCGANLMDAKVHHADFYLVDLRWAIFSKAQEAHFTRSGAILRSGKR
jgi:uncharacterized protein YjbI with pentapeptide repeats